jgi:hypothetical protein
LGGEVRKIIQLNDSGQVLCDDGTVWESKGDEHLADNIYVKPYWLYLGGIPQGDLDEDD